LRQSGFFFGTFFFQIKKKVERSPFYKRLFLKALSVRKEKVERFPFTKGKNSAPSADTEKNPRRFPLREFV
jgi:hypothetical protein